jgi:hypothetical protein
MRPILDKSTLTFLARRLAHAIESEFKFAAMGIADVESRLYQVKLTLDPHTRRVASATWRLLGADGTPSPYAEGDRNREAIVETELRDLFLMSNAWEQLRFSPADPFLTIDQTGRSYRGPQNG